VLLRSRLWNCRTMRPERAAGDHRSAGTDAALIPADPGIRISHPSHERSSARALRHRKTICVVLIRGALVWTGRRMVGPRRDLYAPGWLDCLVENHRRVRNVPAGLPNQVANTILRAFSRSTVQVH
jgi:hypothetical protein